MDYLAVWISSQFGATAPDRGTVGKTYVRTFKTDKNDGHLYNAEMCNTGSDLFYRVRTTSKDRPIHSVPVNGSKDTYLLPGDLVRQDMATRDALANILRSEQCVDIEPCDEAVKAICCNTERYDKVRSVSGASIGIIVIISVAVFFALIMTATTIMSGKFKGWSFDLKNAIGNK
jgi:hypothetical protein